ncbi:uncharacterized protein TRIADDRAFT_29589 [Trichoplax adhaerens]|uniref:G-protein coupled receptors family 3 profile domain-containing protein n=1 Tax=Trichoplax adhaerens TaxID=10228 RepID=B3S607_TRIAD|nr:hypothetical protein TRIADDRAFT_29589 [Trichoplax adhaerens]EDV21896.1 hypothetical protein TRIADDRAFT_29589 [Trichoplax adhaerens]|eukprot:XP_002115533.1 hypothetical protein TRIADDRAFT_29589 [Trichoplax adhaerens]
MLIYLSLGAVCTVFTWIVIILYRHTAVVKASDFMLSQMFLLGILMCMSTAVSFAAPVSMLNCSVGFIWFCTSVVFIVSIIFVKTNRVSRVFESGFVKSFKTRVYLSYQGPAILVVFLTVIQIAICFIANYFDPIQVNRLVISEDIVYLQCRSNTRIGYAIAVGYFSVLCICCVYWAFKTRKLPENFCEAKYINFTSLIILMSLLTMVPSYFGTAGPIQAAISSFGIITLALAILLCMFSPKLYIILLHPEQNTRENAIADIANYSFNQVGTPITSRQKLVHVGRTTPAISPNPSEVLEMTPEISKERIN